MIRFYAPEIEIDHKLPAEDSGHCIRVLRKNKGDIVEVVDGKGFVFTCRISDANPRCVVVELLNKHQEPPHWHRHITIAVAPTKNADRMEWFAEKATEMGIDRLVLLRCKHSERKTLKTDRLRRITASAMKQSLKATLPEITELLDFEKFIKSLPVGSCRWIAHCEENMPRMQLKENMPAENQDIVILIGPEGDFSQQEIEIASANGFKPITMGKSRLRTETAAIFALAALHATTD